MQNEVVCDRLGVVHTPTLKLFLNGQVGLHMPGAWVYWVVNGGGALCRRCPALRWSSRFGRTTTCG